MFHNVKVDIVYYKSNTDFEMEFNLCGCCRMRLLTDKASDQKALVHSLARAVSRSQIVIIVGSLFGAEGIIKTVAKSINSPLSVVDNKKYGIATDDEIEIISTATPLVTADGLFGGCIIESGPQTMILVSDSKNVRKSIMQNLIHPYIEELCAAELHEKAVSTTEKKPESAAQVEEADLNNAVEAKQEPILDAELVLDDEDIVEEDTADDTAEAENELDVEKTDEEAEKAETADNEIENTEPISSDEQLDDNVEISPDFIPVLETEYTPLPEEEEDDILFTPGMFEQPDIEDTLVADFDDEDQPYFYEEVKAHKTSATNILLLIISILLLLAIAILCYCIFYVPSKDGASSTAYVKEIFETLFG